MKIDNRNRGKFSIACEIMEAIERDCLRDFSLDKLAGELYRDKYNICRILKAAMGESPRQYHNKCRCEHALELLEDRNLKISEIAKACGYNSHSQFSTAFYRVFGISPSEYRNDYAKNTKKIIKSVE